MLLVLSHVLAFSVLFVASIFDLKTTEVPDAVSVAGVLGGITLHGLATLEYINFSILSNLGLMVSEPITWFSAVGEPLSWSLGIGIIFSIYGWGLYYYGMWGGADAFAMSVLGFAAPYGVGGASILYPLNIFVNILIAGLLYTLAFSLYEAFKQPEVWKNTAKRIRDDEKRITLEIFFAGIISGFGAYTGSFNGLSYFGVFLAMIFLYRFLMEIQEEVMVYEMPVEELEGGEVIAEEDSGEKKIVGITEDEIGSIEKDTVEVHEGIRFIPVFLIALLITDLFGGGIHWVMFIFN